MSSGIPISSPPAPAGGRPSVSAGSQWSGRILSTLVVWFLFFDGITKAMKISAVLAASVRLGLSETVIAAIGVTLLVCTILYVIPRTSILDAVLLNGYLGGAVAIQLRIGNPLFSQPLFPAHSGVLVWLGLYLGEARLRALIPLRS